MSGTSSAKYLTSIGYTAIDGDMHTFFDIHIIGIGAMGPRELIYATGFVVTVSRSGTREAVMGTLGKRLSVMWAPSMDRTARVLS